MLKLINFALLGLQAGSSLVVVAAIRLDEPLLYHYKLISWTRVMHDQTPKIPKLLFRGVFIRFFRSGPILDEKSTSCFAVCSYLN